MTTHNMEEAEQCDRLVVMADGKVVATGTAADITRGRMVVEIRCDDWTHVFALLDTNKFPVQMRGNALRVASPTAPIAALLSRERIDATVEVVPADLEEAFVAIVAKPTAG